jgi:hypothetical protein
MLHRYIYPRLLKSSYALLLTTQICFSKDPSSFTQLRASFSLTVPVQVLRIRDPVIFYPLDPRSGSGINSFWIRDELSFWLLTLAPETIRSNKKIFVIILFILHHYLYVGSGIRNEKCSDPDSGWKKFRIRIWDKTYRIRNTWRYR